MRDPKRISIFCNEFANFWQTYCPDLRFWQVLGIIADHFENEYFRKDPFYAEEEDWQKAIQKTKKNFEKTLTNN